MLYLGIIWFLVGVHFRMLIELWCVFFYSLQHNIDIVYLAQLANSFPFSAVSFKAFVTSLNLSELDASDRKFI